MGFLDTVTQANGVVFYNAVQFREILPSRTGDDRLQNLHPHMVCFCETLDLLDLVWAAVVSAQHSRCGCTWAAEVGEDVWPHRVWRRGWMKILPGLA